ncbi:DsrE family protein [Thalassotalea litorea]|uniref:DsrE family protein n=1 Tax=Thalassotalea litorea TaxID=2020715 RepID=UPI0037356CA8
MFKNLILAVSLPFTLFTGFANAKPAEFSKGPVIQHYGQKAQIPGALKSPEQQQFKIIFDISEASEKGKINSSYNTVARFINMHVAAGVPLENLDIAMIIHGKATNEMLVSKQYQQRFDGEDLNADLLAKLLAAEVDIYVCGQSASYYGVAAADLKPGITMALSAMTANQLLQQQGYILNPF